MRDHPLSGCDASLSDFSLKNQNENDFFEFVNFLLFFIFGQTVNDFCYLAHPILMTQDLEMRMMMMLGLNDSKYISDCDVTINEKDGPRPRVGKGCNYTMKLYPENLQNEKEASLYQKHHFFQLSSLVHLSVSLIQACLNQNLTSFNQTIHPFFFLGKVVHCGNMDVSPCSYD